MAKRRLLKSKDVAARLGVGPNQVARYVARHGLPATLLDGGGRHGTLVIDEADFVAWVRDVWPTIQPRGHPRRGVVLDPPQ